MQSNILSFEERPAYEFNQWLDNAAVGDKFCYHKGEFLQGQAGRLAYAAYVEGKIILFQRREKKAFSYWAQRR